MDKKMTGAEFISAYIKDGKILANDCTEITTDLDARNLGITTLENIPGTIRGNCNFGYNEIATVKKLPAFVQADFYLNDNSLDTCPDLSGMNVQGNIHLNDNPFEMLGKLPDKFCGTLYLNNTGIASIAKADLPAKTEMVKCDPTVTVAQDVTAEIKKAAVPVKS